MTRTRMIITVFTILILTSCRRGYKVEDGKVFYEYWNEGSGQGKKLVEKADAKTFQEFSLNCDCNFEFGKDKVHLFIDGQLIKNIDPNTFKYIGNYIFRDKDSAYFFGFYDSLNDCVIKGINANKIKLIKYPWAKTDNILIHGSDTVHVDDINEFNPIDDYWGKTKKHIINKNQILDGADIETFESTSSFQGKDKSYNYEFGFINEDDFKKTSYKTFDFDKKDFCEITPIVFVDIYTGLMSYKADKNKKIQVVEKLISKDFSVNSIKISNWAGESKIISVSLSNDKCNCIVEKLYRYDYSNAYETDEKFNVTERIHCRGKERKD
jgi:hypothetical protein